jgi:cysteine desulfuration protein SufE|tara:strand:+ start:145 stop:333 length:189 start_codon:yes stop_codon:yes gene_type:complete
MISLLIKILSGQEADEIINSNLYFIKKIGMNKLIGSQRLNGIGHMIKKIKIISIINKKNTTN